MMSWICQAAMVLMVLGCAQAQSTVPGKVGKAAGEEVYWKSPLSKTLQGIDGELQLVQDVRLTAAHRKSMWGMGEMAIDENDPLWSVFRSSPPRNAVLRIVDRQTWTVDEKTLEQPLALVEKARLYGDDRITYLLTVDYSTGMGSYNGPLTFLVEVSGGRLKWLDAIDRATGKRNPITLMRSLKTVWKLADAVDGKGKNLLEAACRPDFTLATDDFTLRYRRYHFDGRNWIMLQRTEKGMSEFEDGFPDLKRFP